MSYTIDCNVLYNDATVETGTLGSLAGCIMAATLKTCCNTSSSRRAWSELDE